MKRRQFALAVVACVWALTSGGAMRAQQGNPAAPAPQFFLGRLSDSMCAASHQAKAGAAGWTDRECIFECVKGLAKYVLVDQSNKVIPIANQDAGGLPLYAGRPVRISGELKDGAIQITRVEAIPAHLHLFHVMTNWRDTPGTRGFLPVAADEARIASTHAKLAVKGPGIDEMKLHAGHVLNALDPALEPKGPGAGYGVKKATAGAMQHLEFATKGEGMTANISAHAAPVTASLTEVARLTDQATAVAQKARSSTDAAEVSKLVGELDSLTTQISAGLQEAQNHMTQMLKGEGLESFPR
jgi:hypothetical protein